MAEVRAIKRGKKWQYIFEIAKVGGKRQRISKSGFDTILTEESLHRFRRNLSIQELKIDRRIR